MTARFRQIPLDSARSAQGGYLLAALVVVVVNIYFIKNDNYFFYKKVSQIYITITQLHTY
jgi:hypothetical protein